MNDMNYLTTTLNTKNNNDTNEYYENDVDEEMLRTKIWLKIILNQIINNNGDLYVELDHNQVNITNDSAISIINMLRTSVNYVPKSVETIFLLLYSITILFGIATNLLLIIAFYRSEKLKTIRNTFIMNLAISDILLVSICAPLTLFRVFDLRWHLGRWLCKLGPGLQATNVLASAFSITAIAIDRYQYIIYPSNDTTKKIGAIGCSVILWLVAVLLSMPSFITTDLKTVKWLETGEVVYSSCIETWTSPVLKRAYSIFFASIHFVIPLLIICASNCALCFYLRHHVPSVYAYNRRRSELLLNSFTDPNIKKKLSHDKRSSSCVSNNYEPTTNTITTDTERYNRSKVLLTFVAISFGLCWSPLVTLNLIADTDWTIFNASKFIILFLSCYFIAMTSTCINPILYGILNSNFKEEITNMLTGVLHKVSQSQSMNMITYNNARNNYGATCNGAGVSRVNSRSSFGAVSRTSFVEYSNANPESRNRSPAPLSNESSAEHDINNNNKTNLARVGSLKTQNELARSVAATAASGTDSSPLRPISNDALHRTNSYRLSNQKPSTGSSNLLTPHYAIQLHHTLNRRNSLNNALNEGCIVMKDPEQK